MEKNTASRKRPRPSGPPSSARPGALQAPAEARTSPPLRVRLGLLVVAALVASGVCLLYGTGTATPPALTLSLPTSVYQPAEAVVGTVEVTASTALTAHVQVLILDEATRTRVLTQTLPVAVAAGGRTHLSWTFTPHQPGVYTAEAHLIQDTLLATARARFGVRSADVPAGVPAHILRAAVATIDVPAVQRHLQESAATGRPVPLWLGDHGFTVQLGRPAVLLAPGVEIPGLGRPDSFSGQVVGPRGHVLPGSLVQLTVVQGSLGGLVTGPRDPAEPTHGLDTLWIEPLTRFVADAPPDRHLLYWQTDTIPPPEVGPAGHGQPVVLPPAPGEEAPLQPVPPR